MFIDIYFYLSSLYKSAFEVSIFSFLSWSYEYYLLQLDSFWKILKLEEVLFRNWKELDRIIGWIECDEVKKVGGKFTSWLEYLILFALGSIPSSPYFINVARSDSKKFVWLKFIKLLKLCYEKLLFWETSCIVLRKLGVTWSWLLLKSI